MRHLQAHAALAPRQLGSGAAGHWHGHLGGAKGWTALRLCLGLCQRRARGGAHAAGGRLREEQAGVPWATWGKWRSEFS